MTAPFTVAAEPYDGPDARRLVAALDADVEERYAADADADADEGSGPDESMLAVGPESVAPPRGAFLIARAGEGEDDGDDAGGGHAVGCVALRPAPTGEGGTAELKRLYVVPAARGRGVGRLLVQAIEREARALGYRRIILETGSRQPEAMALYRSAGYELITAYGAYRTSSLTRCYGKALPGPAG